jgi:hypothetical protein
VDLQGPDRHAPNGGICDPASDQTVGVRYTAVYRFFSDDQ